MSRPRVWKANTQSLVKEQHEKGAKNCETKIEELRLEPFLTHTPVATRISASPTKVAQGEKVATRKRPEVKQLLVGS